MKDNSEQPKATALYKSSKILFWGASISLNITGVDSLIEALKREQERTDFINEHLQ